MKAPLFIIAGILGLVLAVVACDDPEEDLAPAVTPTSSGSTAPVVTAPPTSPAATTPVPVPSDWMTYSNAELGFSVAYPPDLEVFELPHQIGPTPLPPGGLDEFDVEFKSAKYGFAVSVFVAGTDYYTIDQFADKFYCARDMRDDQVSGYPAVTCEFNTMVEGVSGSAVVAEHGGRFYAITAAYWPDETQLAAMFDSFRFVD
jgi:hypothetical protein